MNQIIAISLSIVIAAMFALTGCNWGREGNQARPNIAGQPATVTGPNALVDGENWLSESEERLARWYAFHEKSAKGFKAADFVLVDTFHDVEFIELEVTRLDPVLAKYRLPSPDGKKQLDIYGYGRRLLPEKGGKLELAAESLDAEVALYGMAVEEKLRLLFCGGHCQFEDAAWIDGNRLVVAGTSSEMDEKNHPALWCIQLSTQSVFRYMHPAVLEAEPTSFFNTVIVSK